MTFMTKSFDVCIRGAGIVGSVLALQLASQRLRVALVKSPASVGGNARADVRAYALNQRSRDVLKSVRCWPDAQNATPITHMQVFGDKGGRVQFLASEQASEALTWVVDVPALESLLGEALRYQGLVEVFDAAQPATLTVVCEGKASATRKELGVEFDTQPYGQSALACRVQCEKKHGQTARQWFAGGEILAFLPMEGEGSSACAIVWSLAPERARQLQGLSAEAFQDALGEASHGTLGAVSLCSERVVWPLQHAQARRWSGKGGVSGMSGVGAWVLAGDAAHNVHPLAGQGLNLGLGDVQELVRILSARAFWREVNDPKLLRQYERARKADFAVVGGSGDALQRLFAHNHALVRSVRNWGMNRFEQTPWVKQWVAQRAIGTD
jgi:2-polyprenyl-6-methoxyphenol hydroxylase-like FAD-dependent oxidoreductase